MYIVVTHRKNKRRIQRKAAVKLRQHRSSPMPVASKAKRKRTAEPRKGPPPTLTKGGAAVLLDQTIQDVLHVKEPVLQEIDRNSRKESAIRRIARREAEKADA